MSSAAASRWFRWSTRSRWSGAAALTLIVAAVTGCGSPMLGGGQPTLTITSLRDAAALNAGARTTLYRTGDRNTADFIISDLAVEDLHAIGVSNTTPTGVVVHVHMFLLPKAGRTPIDPTASNATATVYVFAGDAAGVYRGGGFFLPNGQPGGRNFHGRLADADLRLARASDYFDDRLGPSLMAGRIRGQRDEQTVTELLNRLAVLGEQIPEIRQTAGR